jgi:hypothetical protein
MPISYCCLVSNATKILLADYPQGFNESNWMRISNLLTKIQNGPYTDDFKIENSQMVTYVRTKHVIFTCISVENTKDSIQVFLEKLIKKTKSEFVKLERLISSSSLVKRCQQEKIYPLLDELITEMNKEIHEKSITLDKILLYDQENKNEQLIPKMNHTTSSKLERSDNSMKKNKIWRIIIVCLGIVVMLGVVYGVCSYSRCGNVWNLFCIK